MKTKHSPEMKFIDVVVLEDEAETRQMIVDSIEGFTDASRIRAFASEEEVVRFLDRQTILSSLHHQRPPRLIILDLNVRGVKSFKTLRRLRELKLTRTTPIVIFSDSGDALDISKSYELGANAFVRKPVQFDKFDEAVESIGQFWLTTNQM